MNLRTMKRNLGVCITLLNVVCLSPVAGTAMQAAPQTDDLRTQVPAVRSTVDRQCGDELVFDRNSGRMVKKNRVDLIIKKVELDRGTGGRVAVKPTIVNRCPGTVSRDVHVAIDDVVITFPPTPYNTPMTYGSWIVLGTKASYLIRVDYDNRISEINERNNSCSASFPSSLNSKVHICR